MATEKEPIKIRIGVDPYDTPDKVNKIILDRLKHDVSLRYTLDIPLLSHKSDLLLSARADAETNREIINLLIGYYERLCNG